MKKASDNLVRAAQNAAFNKADDDNIVVKTKFVGGIAQVKSPSRNLLSNKHQGIRRNSHRKFKYISKWIECEKSFKDYIYVPNSE